MRSKIQRLFVVALAMFVAIGCLQAVAQTSSQAGGTSQGMATSDDVKAAVKAHLQQLSSELNLTDEQKEKLKPILQSEFQDMRSIRNDSTLSPDEKRAKAQQVHSTYQPQIQNILTPEQQQKLSTMRQGGAESTEDKQ